MSKAKNDLRSFSNYFMQNILSVQLSFHQGLLIYTPLPPIYYILYILITGKAIFWLLNK